MRTRATLLEDALRGVPAHHRGDEEALPRAQGGALLMDLVTWLRSLPMRQQQVVVLLAVFDLNQTETAEVLGCSRAMVWKRWMAAKRALEVG